ncbi:MAG: MFS transporter [Acidimicrobiales bacterium]|nr:MFS transporter [Acidimicrobiales bacterium]MCB9394039.1 MFS transporter [Acidimicrobiaceae bacterium]
MTASLDAVPALSDHERDELQRRTLVTLRLAQVPSQAAVAAMVAVVALLVGEMIDNQRLAGTGNAMFTLGSALVAVPLSAYMRRHGRRPGLVRAWSAASIGALVAGVAGQLEWFPLFVVGMLVFGTGQAAALQGRFVAADLATASTRSRAIGSVVWVGTLGAAFGPLLTPWERRLAGSLGLQPLVGPFFFAALLFAASAAVTAVRMRPDPLVAAGLTDPHAERVRPLRQIRGAVAVVAARPLAQLGLASMVISQTAMVAVMTMTPPYMKDHGHSELSAYVIALHIVGMYGFSPFVGRVVERIGRIPSIMVGSLILGVGTFITVMVGYDAVLVFIGLFLLGVGWSFGLVAGSTLLTESVPAEARVEVQGSGDLLMSLCGGSAAFASGFVKASFGYGTLAYAATVLGGVLVIYAMASRKVTPTVAS